MRPTRRQLLGTAAALTVAPIGRAEDAATKLLIVVGPSNHPPGTHEVAAGGRLLKHCLETADGIEAEVVTDWPQGDAEGDRVRRFHRRPLPAGVMPNRDRIMNDLGQ